VLEQKQPLYDSLKSAKELQIDLGGVTEIDSSGVQLLMLLKQESVSRHIKLCLTQAGRPVVKEGKSFLAYPYSNMADFGLY
jgi:anti-sigma B factor antagonist